MPPLPAFLDAPEPAKRLLAAYRAWLASRGLGNPNFEQGARWFLVRWPAPQAWAREPLGVRLAAGTNVRPLLNFLMLHGHLRPGYDYLLERKLPALLRELPPAHLAHRSTGSWPPPMSWATPGATGPGWPPRSLRGC